MFSFLWDRLSKRIYSWKNKLLSKLKNEVVLKMIAQALSIFCTSVFLLPLTLVMLYKRWWTLFGGVWTLALKGIFSYWLKNFQITFSLSSYPLANHVCFFPSSIWIARNAVILDTPLSGSDIQSRAISLTVEFFTLSDGSRLWLSLNFSSQAKSPYKVCSKSIVDSSSLDNTRVTNTRAIIHD